MGPKARSYIKGIWGSLLVHALLLSFLIFSFNTPIDTRPTGQNTQNATQKNIVQAVVVDQQQVEAEVQRLVLEDQQKKEQVLQQEQALAKKLKQVEQQRIEEQAKLHRLKQDMLKFKKVQEQEVQQLEKLKKETQLQQRNLAALDDEHKTEQERLKQVRLSEAQAQQHKQAEVLKEKANHAQMPKGQQTKTAAAEQASARANHAKILADKARIAAHQQKINSEIQAIVAQWSEKIRNNRRLMMESMPTHLSCRVALQILPDGSVHPRLIQSSGNAVYDDLSIKAIYKSEPFELPENPALRDQLRNIELNFLNDEDGA